MMAGDGDTLVVSRQLVRTTQKLKMLEMSNELFRDSYSLQSLPGQSIGPARKEYFADHVVKIYVAIRALNLRYLLTGGVNQTNPIYQEIEEYNFNSNTCIICPGKDLEEIHEKRVHHLLSNEHLYMLNELTKLHGVGGFPMELERRTQTWMRKQTGKTAFNESQDLKRFLMQESITKRRKIDEQDSMEESFANAGLCPPNGDFRRTNARLHLKVEDRCNITNPTLRKVASIQLPNFAEYFVEQKDGKGSGSAGQQPGTSGQQLPSGVLQSSAAGQGGPSRAVPNKYKRVENDQMPWTSLVVSQSSHQHNFLREDIEDDDHDVCETSYDADNEESEEQSLINDGMESSVDRTFSPMLDWNSEEDAKFSSESSSTSKDSIDGNDEEVINLVTSSESGSESQFDSESERDNVLDELIMISSDDDDDDDASVIVID